MERERRELERDGEIDIGEKQRGGRETEREE